MEEMKEIGETVVLDEMIIEPIKYLFCYGSNNSQQIFERIQSNKPLIYMNAYLQDHVRIFAGTSQRWRGGIVGLYPQSSLKTYGILVHLTESQLLLMDEFEKGYERKTIVVNTQVSETVTEIIESEVYWKTNINFEYLPSTDYLCSIHQMLQERTGLHKENIIIRGIINDELREIGIWKPKYGLQMKL